MIAATIGSATAIVLAILAATWALGVRMGRVEENMKGIKEDVTELKERVFRTRQPRGYSQ